MKSSPTSTAALTESLPYTGGRALITPLPSPGPLAECDELELFRLMRSADAEDRARIQAIIVDRHAGLVRWLAAQYANAAVDPDDLRQVGYLGLLLAIKRFDPDRGIDFVSFARPTVQGEIRRYFRDKRRWIRLPRRIQEAKAAIRRANDTLTPRLGRDPSAAELAQEVGLPEAEVLEALSADDTFTITSLDAPLCSEDGEAFTVADTVGELETALDTLIDCAALRPLIAALPERERRMLHMRFYQDMTQSQIGVELGISQMHVSRVLARTLSALQQQLLEESPEAA